MKQVLIELDDATARRLERVAPTRARQRSKFIRVAIQRALDEIAERETAAAYRANPGTDGAAFFDASIWDEWTTTTRRRKRR